MSNAKELNSGNWSQEVENSDVPVMVDFWAEWCMPCRMLGPVVDEVAGDFDGKAKVGKVNVDADGTLAAKYGIQGIPALLFFKNGELTDRLVGVQPKAAIAQKLNSLIGA